MEIIGGIVKCYWYGLSFYDFLAFMHMSVKCNKLNFICNVAADGIRGAHNNDSNKRRYFGLFPQVISNLDTCVAVPPYEICDSCLRDTFLSADFQRNKISSH